MKEPANFSVSGPIQCDRTKSSCRVARPAEPGRRGRCKIRGCLLVTGRFFVRRSQMGIYDPNRRLGTYTRRPGDPGDGITGNRLLVQAGAARSCKHYVEARGLAGATAHGGGATQRALLAKYLSAVNTRLIAGCAAADGPHDRPWKHRAALAGVRRKFLRHAGCAGG